MSVLPISGFDDWKRTVKEKREKDPLQTFAILLYSDANERLFEFVHKRYLTLDNLTAEDFTVFVIWYLLIKDTVTAPHSFGGVSKEITAYDLARHFDFEIQKVPCLVFFREITKSDIIIYRLNDAWEDSEILEEFEKLTDDVTKARRKAKGKKKPAEAQWRALEWALRRRRWIRGAAKATRAAMPILDVVQAILNLLPKE
ncbi:MAG: hypothetical protein ACFFAY_13710 [Promethearchaeota archaeon]